jgi:hypothetical protein
MCPISLAYTISVLKYAALSFADIVLIAGWKGHVNAKK